MLLLNLFLWTGLAAAWNGRHQPVSRVVSSENVDSSPRARPAATSSAPTFTYAELYNLQIKFLDNFIYPANQKQAKAINSTLFAEDVLGRVDITRTFRGRELNTEYLFGLFANLAATPGQISLLGVPISYQIMKFAASGNIATASTMFEFNFTALNRVLPIRIDSWNTYNADGQISQYDATFVWWGWTVQTLLQAAAPSLGAKSTAVVEQKLQKALAKNICSTAMQYCQGTNVQYKSADQCFKKLATEVRFGQPWEMGRNTLLCRMVHQNMVPLRPSVHCPHIGPTGGGYCTDEPDYLGTVTDDCFSNPPSAVAPWQPQSP